MHHQKHHAAYVNNLNASEEKAAEAMQKSKRLFKTSSSSAHNCTGDVRSAITLQPAIKFNGGGHINHSIFWTNLTPMKDSGEPAGEIL